MSLVFTGPMSLRAQGNPSAFSDCAKRTQEGAQPAKNDRKPRSQSLPLLQEANRMYDQPVKLDWLKLKVPDQKNGVCVSVVKDGCLSRICKCLSCLLRRSNSSE